MTAPAFFVTGTDTDVGKTLVAAWLVHHWQAYYWKPMQCGTGDGTDPERIARLSGAAPDRVLSCRHVLQAPLSPHAAAALENVTLKLDDFELPRVSGPLIVEGAGGALVPINNDDLMVDLMVQLGLPVLVVARSTLGTINHTLMTLEALRVRGLTISGVIMSGPLNDGNRHAIETYGNISVLAELPLLNSVSADALAAWPSPPPPEHWT